MNRLKVTVSQDSGKSLCKVGWSLDPSEGEEYTNEEIAVALEELAASLRESHLQQQIAVTWKEVIKSITPIDELKKSE